MHKPFYASGFLYHSPSQQILLQPLQKGDAVHLALFCDKCDHGKDPLTVFKHCVEQALGIRIPVRSIHPVYDYIHDKLGAQYIFYVETKGKEPKSYGGKYAAGWFPLLKLAKHKMSEQTRHDVIVGERVIRSLSAAPRTYANR